MFQAADITTHEQIEHLFSNYTWTSRSTDLQVDQHAHVKHWTAGSDSIFINLAIYMISTFFLSILFCRCMNS